MNYFFLSLRYLQAFLHGYLALYVIGPQSSSILNFPTHNSKMLYFRVERVHYMWPIISISVCLSFSNSHCFLIGLCLAGVVLKSCHVRMASLSYSWLYYAVLIKGFLLFKTFFSLCFFSLLFSYIVVHNSTQQNRATFDLKDQGIK